MSIGVVRNLGTAESKKEMLSRLDTLPSSNPSSTAESVNTKRKFTKNTYVNHLAGNNMYGSGAGTLISRSGNSATIQYDYGFSCAFVTNCVGGKTYTLKHTLANGALAVMFYASDGTFLSSIGVTTNEVIIQVPSNAEYTLLLPSRIGGDGRVVWTFESLK